MRTHLPSCKHEPRSDGRFSVIACPSCRSVEWFEDGRPVPSEVGVARLFGDFDLVSRLAALNAPGKDVLLYTPTGPGGQRALGLLDPHVWFKVTDHLWLCHDRQVLLLAPTNPLTIANLTRGA